MKHLAILAALAVVCVSSLIAQAQVVQAGLEIEQAKLGKEVVNREIVSEATAFAVDERAYLWMKISGGPADSVTVTWSIDDYSWSTNLNIGASTWRTWAYKTLWKAGEWKVTVTDANGAVLLEKTLTVTP